MTADPQREAGPNDIGRILLKLTIALLVFPVLLLVFLTFIEAPLRLLLAAAPNGGTWVSAVSCGWFLVWFPVAVWGAFKLCKQLWVKL